MQEWCKVHGFLSVSVVCFGLQHEDLLVLVAPSRNRWRILAVKLPPSHRQIPCFHQRQANIAWKSHLLHPVSASCLSDASCSSLFHTLHVSSSFSKPPTPRCWVKVDTRCFGRHLTGRFIILRWSKIRNKICNVLWSFLCAITNERTFSQRRQRVCVCVFGGVHIGTLHYIHECTHVHWMCVALKLHIENIWRRSKSRMQSERASIN